MALTDRAVESEAPLGVRLEDLFTSVKGPPRAAPEAPEATPRPPATSPWATNGEQPVTDRAATPEGDVTPLIRDLEGQLERSRQEARQGLQSVLSALEDLTGRIDKLEAKLRDRGDAANAAEERMVE